MENTTIAPSALQFTKEGLYRWFRNLFAAKPKIFKQKSRAEVIGKVIEDLTFEVTSRDFSNREVAFIINGIARKAKGVLIEREEYLTRELTNTKKSINEIVK